MKKPFIYLLTAGLAVSMITTNNVDGQEMVNKKEDSKATVKFIAPTNPVEIYNPENPTETYSGGDEAAEEYGNVTGQQGPLSLNYVSDIVFDNKLISFDENVSEEDGNLTIKSSTNAPFVQVTDKRGFGHGWELRANAERFQLTNEEGELTEETLPSATISFLNGKTAATKNISTIDPPNVNDEINLITGGAEVTIANAKERTAEEQEATGLGTWLISWLSGNEAGSGAENSNVTLTIPSSNVTAGTHTSSINWTLYDGPGSNTHN